MDASITIGRGRKLAKSRSRGALERSALVDLFRHTLSRIPTVWGRLAYLASLRDVNSGAYRHHGLSATYGRDESVAALRESHERVFLEWLTMPLPAKYADLTSYFADLEDSRDSVVKHWLRTRVFRMFTPDLASAAERELFTSEFDLLLEMFTNASAGSLDPKSSQQR